VLGNAGNDNIALSWKLFVGYWTGGRLTTGLPFVITGRGGTEAGFFCLCLAEGLPVEYGQEAESYVRVLHAQTFPQTVLGGLWAAAWGRGGFAKGFISPPGPQILFFANTLFHFTSFKTTPRPPLRTT